MSVSQSSLVNATRQKNALTENGALTNSTTLSNTLNLFFLAGASRNLSESEIERLVIAAMTENPEDTTKIIFWAGDIRGGAGERRFFKTALKVLERDFPETFEKNIQNVAEFNRFDSLFGFYNNKDVMSYLAKELYTNKNGLLAKWMPREGKAGNQQFRRAFLKHMDITPKQYRKLVVRNSKTVETNLSNKDYTFEYSYVPSVAFNKYRKAFARNDQERFFGFIQKSNNGKAKINAGAIFPYDIYRSYSSRGNDRESINAQWNQLPDYIGDSEERILPVCDVSGSMHGTPMEISVSLGVYISERNKSIFKDAFITFSERPQMNYLKGNTTQRFDQLQRADWGYNTNLVAVFGLVLDSAVRSNISQDEMPTKILIISDMEFDQASKTKTNFEKIREIYNSYGYKLPDLIFWNVNARSTSNFPVAYNEEGVALVSGASPTILKSVLSGSLSPIKIMKDTIGNKRYNVVKY